MDLLTSFEGEGLGPERSCGAVLAEVLRLRRKVLRGNSAVDIGGHFTTVLTEIPRHFLAVSWAGRPQSSVQQAKPREINDPVKIR